MHTRVKAGYTIFRLNWRNHRLGFTLLLTLAAVCGVTLPLVTAHLSNRDASDAMSYIPMGLSLFLVFVFCSFTETDRKGRFEGYPAHLFTLPVSTGTLIAAPVLFSVGAILTIYALWGAVVLPATGRHLPFAWPCAYLAAGMVCYQSILWCLARFRIARLLVLGISGAIFSTSWLLFRQDFERDVSTGLVPDGFSPRTALYLALAALIFFALIVAYRAVESDRRGGRPEWQGWRILVEASIDLLSRHHRRFQSAGQAQFWFEWRRHGLVLPLGTAGVLFVIMLPAVFVRPLSAEWTVLCLGGILLTPLLLAFTFGKGFGKADLWSKSSTLRLYLATRPLRNTEWIAAKMKAAALAAMSTWGVVAFFTTLWLQFCCDTRLVEGIMRHAASIYPGIGSYGAMAIFAAIAVVLTWRLLIGSLYVGLSGKHWMLALAGVGVFVALFASIFLLAALSSNPAIILEYILSPRPAWLWALAVLLVLKVAGAWLLAEFARRQGLLIFRAALRYLALWFVITLALIIVVWFSAFEHGYLRRGLVLLALLAVPLLRVSFAPIALAWGQRL